MNSHIDVCLNTDILKEFEDGKVEEQGMPLGTAKDKGKVPPDTTRTSDITKDKERKLHGSTDAKGKFSPNIDL